MGNRNASQSKPGEDADDTTGNNDDRMVDGVSLSVAKKDVDTKDDNVSSSSKSNVDSEGNGEENGPERKGGTTTTTSSRSKSTLDDTTLQAIKNYLTQGITQDILEEEEVTINAVKTSRYANERTRYRQNVVEGSDLEGEDETFYARVYREEESYAIANDFFKSVTLESQQRHIESMEGDGDADADDFEMDKRTLKWLKKAAGLVRPYDPLDVQPQGTNLSEDEELEGDGDESGGDNIPSPAAAAAAPRRMTRGLARSTRVKRREERIRIETQGLNALMEALGELESERGPFQEKKREIMRKPKHIVPVPNSSDSEDTDDRLAFGTRRSKVRLQEATISPRRASRSVLVARLPSLSSAGSRRKGWGEVSKPQLSGPREIKLTRILVEGKHIEGVQKSKKEHQRLRLARHQLEKQSRHRHESPLGHMTYLAPPSSKRKRQMAHRHVDFDHSDDHSSSSDNTDVINMNDLFEGRLFGKIEKQSIFHPRMRQGDSANDPISLDILDWRRRLLLQKRAKKKSKNKVGEQAQYNPLEVIPDILVQGGMVRRLPPREVAKPTSKPFAATRPSHFDPPRTRHSDQVYATMVKKLMDSLSGGGKRWAHHEFFYSDIDRGWYDSSDFVSDLAKMGVLPHTKLTKRELSFVRRRLPNRPRRFSTRFIFQEVKKRNRYRNIVRQLQRCPEHPNPLGCGIPGPIRVGTTVTAYNKRLRILHRGVVLFHDSHAHGYLVQFERKELGFEFCPDTEVASHGVPEILVPPANHHLHGALRLDNHISDVGTLQYGTRRGPGGVAPLQRNLSAKDEVATWLGVERKGNTNGRSPNRLKGLETIELVAERETLVVLMATIKAASNRKSMILQSLQKFNGLVGELPHMIGVGQRDTEQLYAWLIVNLQFTNHALDTALVYLHTLYGKAFSKTPPAIAMEEEAQNTLAMENGIWECCRVAGGPPSTSIPWASTLVLDSRDVGNTLADKLLGEVTKFGTTATSVTENRGVLQSRFSAAASLLFTTTYCCESVSTSEPMPSVYGMDASLSAGLSTLIEPLESMFDNDIENLSGRAQAVKELKGALELLKAELALSGAKQSFQV